jgi:hypothetical protein
VQYNAKKIEKLLYTKDLLLNGIALEPYERLEIPKTYFFFSGME